MIPAWPPLSSWFTGRKKEVYKELRGTVGGTKVYSSALILRCRLHYFPPFLLPTNLFLFPARHWCNEMRWRRHFFLAAKLALFSLDKAVFNHSAKWNFPLCPENSALKPLSRPSKRARSLGRKELSLFLSPPKIFCLSSFSPTGNRFFFFCCCCSAISYLLLPAWKWSLPHFFLFPRSTTGLGSEFA